jgi:hypothetical protein
MDDRQTAQQLAGYFRTAVLVNFVDQRIARIEYRLVRFPVGELVPQGGESTLDVVVERRPSLIRL